jgi:hypothetical protein
MRHFISTMCVLEGINVAFRLLALAEGRTMTYPPGLTALNVVGALVILVWGSVLLSKK